MTARFDDLVVTRWGARFQGRNLSCALGRSGIGIKQGEGDGITPVGMFRLDHILVRPDRIAFESPSVEQKVIGPRDIWSDDPKDPAYNLAALGPAYPYSHEALRRADPLYDAVGVLDFNWPEPVAGKGSAIFIHVWRKPRHPTEGCIAFAPQDLVALFSRWTPASRVITRD